MRRLWFLAFPFFIAVAVALSQIPRTISYQGLLTDSLGNAKPDGEYSMVFRLYQSEVGGPIVWQETKILSVKRGLFSTDLGDQVAFGPALKFDGRYWLGIALADGAELSPRLPLNSVAYSFRAANADTARILMGSAPPSGTAGGDLTGTYPSPTIAANAITGGKILDGTVTSDDIQDVVRTVTWPAMALNYLSGGSVIQPSPSGAGGWFPGLTWTNSFTEGLHAPLLRPADWNGTSDLVFKVWFVTTTTASGQVNFFLRPRTYAWGDAPHDAGSSMGTLVSVSDGPRIYELTITIVASWVGTNPYWDFVLQREPGTYADPVIVTSLSMSYTATR